MIQKGMETEWLKRPEFAQMEPEKKEILSNLIRSSKGKPLTQSIPLLMKARQQLQEKNLAFSDAERNLIFDILTSELTPVEKERVARMKQQFFH